MEDRAGVWCTAWAAWMAVTAALGGLVWQSATTTGNTTPLWPAYIFGILSLVGLYFVFAPVFHTWPFRRVQPPHNSTVTERRKARQGAEKKPLPRQGFGISVRAYARHALPNWAPAYEQEPSGSVRCMVYSGDGDKRHLDSCQVTSPGEAVSVARAMPREPQAFFAFDYPSQFEGSVPTLPLPDGEYRVEWNEVGGGLIRIHAITVANGQLDRGGATP